MSNEFKLFCVPPVLIYDSIWSVVLAGSCAACLLLHIFMEYGKPPTDDLQVRLTGMARDALCRRILANALMDQVLLVATIALEALIFSRIVRVASPLAD